MLQFVMQDLLEREDIERIKAVLDEHAKSSSRNGSTILAIRKQLDQHAVMARKKRVATEKAKAEAKVAGKEFEDNELLWEQELDDDDDDAEQDLAPEHAPEQEQEDELELEHEHEHQNEPDRQRNPGRYTAGSQFGRGYNFKPFLASLQTGESWEKAKKKAQCALCAKQPRRPWRMTCGHLLCAEPCLTEVDLRAAEDELSSFIQCPTCKQVSIELKLCDHDGEESPDFVARSTRSQVKKKKATTRERLDREDITEDWLNSMGEDVLPSAKTIAVKAQVMNWLKENPNVKIIIYTQFLAM